MYKETCPIRWYKGRESSRGNLEEDWEVTSSSPDKTYCINSTVVGNMTDQFHMRGLFVPLIVVFEHGNYRAIIFSTFQPDAALLVRKLQSTYPVFFLTNGGTEIYYDVRRNSLEEAVKLCLECGLQGIVSEIKGIFRNPGAGTKIKEAKLSLLTYGQLNNVPEAVYMQHLMGVEGVIVDLVQEITEAVSHMIKPSMEDGEEEMLLEGEG
ncbi:PLC-like phosphodiesterases superfamily protein [Actinidia rufa]|uniref:glycerophosphodiester phosphodiesterase n=1 Tax=Actinidia rufa TaxID=165716 RepID=A0A7J0DFP8_9ERIC|nr:PLC-like phosphodiesterases superfamily protein [Actinidia rufa]